MPNCTCPYCLQKEEYNVELDNLAELEQGETIEVNCLNCKKVFLARISWSFYLYGEKEAPCKNGNECSFLALKTKEYKRCVWCGVIKKNESLPQA